MMKSYLTLSIFFIIILSLVSCGRQLKASDIVIALSSNPLSPLTAKAEIFLPGSSIYNVKVVIAGRTSPSSSQPHHGLTITHTFSNRQGKFTLPVLGLYPDHTNQIEFIFQDRKGRDTVIIRDFPTSPLATNLVIPIQIFKNQLKSDDQGVYLVDNLKIAFDQLGEIRWAYTGDSFLNYGKLANGNLIINSEEDIQILYHYPRFYEVSMIGEIVQTYDISDYYGHHDLWEITTGPERGNFLVGVNEAAPGIAKNVGEDGVGQEDTIFLIDRMTGEVKRIWDLKKLFDAHSPYLHHIPRGSMMHPDDWIHENAHYYDPVDDSIVFSSRHQSAIVKFDFHSGKLIWILTDNTGKQWTTQTNFYGQVISEFVLEPVISTTSSPETTTIETIEDPGAVNFWPYGQHAVKRIGGEGEVEQILLYDNGNSRNYFQYGRKAISKQKNFSRVVEYRVNKKNMTVEKVWEFDAGKKYFTIATGSVDVLPNGNRLIGFMWVSKDEKTPRVIELDPDDNVVFEALFNEGKTFYYQIEKFDLYQGLK